MGKGSSTSRKVTSKRRYVTGSRRASVMKPPRAAPAPAIRQADPQPAAAHRYANVRRGSAALVDVPPFCFLDHARSLEEALRAAVKALGLTHAAEIVGLTWKLRAVAEGRGR